MPPDTKTKLISIQTLNLVISIPAQKQVNSDPYTEIKSTPIPHTKFKSVSTTHTTTKLISMPALEPCHFRAAYFARYTHGYMFLWYSGNTYNINTSTNSDDSWRVHTTVKPRKSCLGIYTIL